MTFRRTVADFAIATLHRTARVLGPRFYRLYLDELNRRYNDHGERVAAEIAGVRVAFVCPNQLTRWRVETLYQKEPATIAWIDGFAEGDVFWDVGANIGIYSLYAARARNCRVVAFEPAPANYALLARNVAVNDLSATVMALPIALSATRAIASLGIADDLAGSALAHFGDGQDDAPLRLAALGMSIDQLISGFKPPFPNHLKIDVDGSEGDIVAGAKKTLADQRLKSLSVELDDQQPEQAQHVIWVLAEAGFRKIGAHRSPMFPDSPAQNVHFARLSS